LAVYDINLGTFKQFPIPLGAGVCTKFVVEVSERMMIASFTDLSFCLFKIENGQFVKKIQDS